MTQNQVVTQEDNKPAAVSQTQGVIQMIERVCVDPNFDVNKMQQLLEMQERVLDRQAEQEFQNALADMQAELPAIEKNGTIKDKNGNVVSHYAKFEDVNRTIMPFMQKHGFSINFETQQGQGAVHVVGTLRHRGGHKVSTMLGLPTDTGGFKNAVQAVGSSVSYGKRYVMSALLNLTTTDEDDDGQSAVDSVNLMNHNTVLRDHFHTVYQVKQLLGANQCYEARELMTETLTDEEKEALWVATTKGGIFTTEERNKIREPSKYEAKQNG